jgi:NADPH:quinone reductase and related Zn-dependent oxidoreductases
VRAVVTRDGELVLRDLPTPEPHGEQVLVETAGAGINRADLLQRRGAYPAPVGWPADTPGLELSGTVAATGDAVTRFRVGDRVFGIVGGGAHASHVLTTEDLLVPVPDGLDLVAMGGVPEAFVTAHDALVTRADLRSGERVLINGVGSGVGTAAVQLCKVLGATSVGTSRTPRKLERSKALGLDLGVLASEEMAEEIGEVDVVLELLGGSYLSLDLEVARPKARIVLVGLIAGAAEQIDLSLVLRKRLDIGGTVLRSRPHFEKAAATDAFARQVVPLLAAGRLEPVVDEVTPLEEATAAYDLVASNQTFGKVILKAG